MLKLHYLIILKLVKHGKQCYESVREVKRLNTTPVLYDVSTKLRIKINILKTEKAKKTSMYK